MCQHHENIEEDKFGFQYGKCKLCKHVTEYGLLHDMLVKIDSRVYTPKGFTLSEVEGLDYSPLTSSYLPLYNIRGVKIG